MPRSRADTHPRRRATASAQQGSGCSSGLLIPPLAVLLVSGLLALFANSQFVTASAYSQSVSSSGYTQTTNGLSPIFRPEIQFWGTRLLAWSAEFGLDPNLAATVMQVESCGHPRARSGSGAMGLFQVMPFHFYASDDPYDPDTNARRGLAYLVRSLERSGGDARLALAGYNGGIGLLGRAEWTWPAETKRYVYFGGQIYEDTRAGLTTSERLEEWYLKYGAGLCKQAHDALGIP